MQKKTSFFQRFYVAICLVFFYLPILVTMIFSFNSSKSLTRFTGFSMRWYTELLHNTEVSKAVYVSVTIAILATVISTVLGTITAIGLSKSRKVLKETLLNINNLPILNPDIVTAIGLMLLFSSLGFRKGYFTMLLAHISFCTPYVITSVYPKVRSLDPNLANAAMDLGATPFQALTKVIVPMIKDGIFAGALLAFTMSFDDFVISYFVSGNGVKNISIVVYNMTKRINPTINALSTIVILVIVLVMVFANVLPKLLEKHASKHAKKIQRVIALLLVFALGFGLIKCGGGAAENHVLKVYNAGEYMDLDLLTQFEQEYNCTVVYETFESNEMMYTKLSGGESYDVLIPSDYMIERLIKEDYLQYIDWDLIPNKGDLMDEVMNKSYDPGNRYSCPYFWGTVGIVYDKTKVDIKDLEKEGYNIFLDQKYKGDIYLYDSERDSFMMALKALGYSMNTSDESQIQEAYNWLVQCVQTMKPEIVTDEIIDNMAQGRKALGLIYSGDATYVINENENMGYYMPEGGTNQWSDAMVIPKNAKNPELAHAFINYASDYDGAYDNSSYVGYTSANKKVMKDLYGKGGEFEGIDAYIPRTDNKNDEVFEYNEETKKEISNLWSKVKIAASNTN